MSIDSIQVAIENGESTLNLGTYHPSNTINIVDFLGYYLARKTYTKAIDFRAPITNFELATNPVAMQAAIPKAGFFHLPPKSPAPVSAILGGNLLPQKAIVTTTPTLPAPIPS